MQRFLTWVKTHPLTVILLAIIVILATRQMNTFTGLSSRSSFSTGMGYPAAESMDYGVAMDSFAVNKMSPILPPRYGGSTNTAVPADQRMVVTNSHLSLLVTDVRDTVSKINSFVNSQGGFMVNSSVNEPEQGATGNVSIRVPVTQLDTTLEYFRSLAVRVVSENISGNDITDQYQDLDARLATLQQTKQKFEEIYNQARTVQEILQVQQSILDTQAQIDSVKGQMEYLKNTADSTLISVYLATDELALPYAPAEPWRPEAIFKEAVRSLVGSLRGVGTLVIWAAVYSPIVIVIAVIIWLIARWNKKKTV